MSGSIYEEALDMELNRNNSSDNNTGEESIYEQALNLELFGQTTHKTQTEIRNENIAKERPEENVPGTLSNIPESMRESIQDVGKLAYQVPKAYELGKEQLSILRDKANVNDVKSWKKIKNQESFNKSLMEAEGITKPENIFEKVVTSSATVAPYLPELVKKVGTGFLKGYVKDLTSPTPFKGITGIHKGVEEFLQYSFDTAKGDAKGEILDRIEQSRPITQKDIDMSNKVSNIAAIPYMIFDYAEYTALGKFASKIPGWKQLKRSILNRAMDYGATIIAESAAEAGQKLVTETAAEITATIQNAPLDENLKQKALRMATSVGKEFVESIAPMAGLTAIGGVGSAVLSSLSADVKSFIQSKPDAAKELAKTEAPSRKQFEEIVGKTGTNINERKEFVKEINNQLIQETQNAENIQENKGTIPQETQVIKEGKTDSGSNIQQFTQEELKFAEDENIRGSKLVEENDNINSKIEELNNKMQDNPYEFDTDSMDEITQLEEKLKENEKEILRISLKQQKNVLSEVKAEGEEISSVNEYDSEQSQLNPDKVKNVAKGFFTLLNSHKLMLTKKYKVKQFDTLVEKMLSGDVESLKQNLQNGVEYLESSGNKEYIKIAKEMKNNLDAFDSVWEVSGKEEVIWNDFIKYFQEAKKQYEIKRPAKKSKKGSTAKQREEVIRQQKELNEKRVATVKQSNINVKQPGGSVERKEIIPENPLVQKADKNVQELGLNVEKEGLNKRYERLLKTAKENGLKGKKASDWAKSKLKETVKQVVQEQPKTKQEVMQGEEFAAKEKGQEEITKSSGSMASMKSPKGQKTISKLLEKANKPSVSTIQNVPTDFKVSDKTKAILKKWGFSVGEKSISSRFLGLFKRFANKVRVQSLYDITTVLHEGIHGIDNKIKFTRNLINSTRHADPIRNELTDIYEALYPGGKRKHSLEKRMTEAVAVLFENYFYDPATIIKLYPNLVNQFIKPTGKYYNKYFSEILEDCNSLVEEYAKLPPYLKFAARIRTGKEVVKQDSGFTFAQRMEFELANRFEPLKRYAKESGVEGTWDDPIIQAFNIMNKNSIISSWVKGNTMPILLKDGNFLIKDGGVESYLKLIKGKEKEFRSYLVARRVFESFNNVAVLKNELQYLTKQKETLEASGLIGENEEDGKSDALVEYEMVMMQINELNHEIKKINDIIKNDDFTLQDAIAVVNQYSQDFIEAEKIFDDINNNLITFAEENGLINSETADKYRNEKGYASFRRFIDDDLSSNGTIKTSSKSKVTSFKERTGSQLDIIDPIYSQILAINEIISKSMENRLWNKVADLAKSNIEISQRFERLELNASVDAKGNVSFPQEKDPNNIRIFVDGKREIYEAAPEFLAVIKTLRGKEFDAFVQALRIPSSVFTRLTTSANPLFALGNITVDQFSAITQTKTGFVPVIDPMKSLIDYIKSDRGIQAYMAMGGQRQTLASYYDLSPDEIIKSLVGDTTTLSKISGFVDSALGVLEFPSNLSEIMTRFAEYQRAVKKGDSMSVAMYKAAEVTTPFQLQGNFGGRLGQELIRSIPYFNSIIQVLYKFGRTVVDDPKRVATVTATILTVGLTSSILLMKYSDDEKKRLFAEQPVNNLSRYLYFPTPFKGLIRIRIPEQFGALMGICNLFLIDNYKKNKSTFDDYLNAITSAIPEQINITDIKKMVLSWIPQVIKPSVLTATNTKTFPEIAPIVPEYIKDKAPSEQYSVYTSKVSRIIGDMLGASPLLVDFWIKQQFGAVGSMILGKLPGNPLYIQEKEFVMFGRSYNRFYDNKILINQQYANVKARPNLYTDKQKHSIATLRISYNHMEKQLSIFRKKNKKSELPEKLKQGIYEKLINLENKFYEIER